MSIALCFNPRYIKIHISFSGDFLYVFDGNTTDPEYLINAETGIIVPQDAHSTAENMIVVFDSDFNSEKIGFKATISYLQSGIPYFINIYR